MKKRNPELELMRFVFCWVIIIHHASNFWDYEPGGCSAIGFSIC